MTLSNFLEVLLLLFVEKVLKKLIRYADNTVMISDTEKITEQIRRKSIKCKRERSINHKL